MPRPSGQSRPMPEASSRGDTRPRYGIFDIFIAINVGHQLGLRKAGPGGGRAQAGRNGERGFNFSLDIWSKLQQCLQEVGSFVVRSSKGSLVLSCRDSEAVKHIKLGEEGDQVHLPTGT